MKIKHIFSKVNIPNLLSQIKKYFKNDHFLDIRETIEKFQACTLDKKFIIYKCPICKSRFCTSCGKKYSTTWA